MAVTTFRSEVSKGSGFQESVTRQFVAHDASIAVYGPVVLSTGSITALTEVASTTTASDKKVIGVCVWLPENGTITVDKSVVGVVIFGLTKVKNVTATVNLGDVIECSATAGQAQVQAALVTRNDTTAHLQADVVTGLNNIRAAFGIALSTVSSGAGSIHAVFVNISCAPGNVT